MLLNELLWLSKSLINLMVTGVRVRLAAEALWYRHGLNVTIFVFAPLGLLRFIVMRDDQNLSSLVPCVLIWRCRCFRFGFC